MNCDVNEKSNKCKLCTKYDTCNKCATCKRRDTCNKCNFCNNEWTHYVSQKNSIVKCCNDDKCMKKASYVIAHIEEVCLV